MSVEETRKVPDEFQKLWNWARSRMALGPQFEKGGLYALPVPPRRWAEVIEESAEYHHFVNAPMFDQKVSPWRIRDTLRRSGFYQNLGRSPDPASAWGALERRLRTQVVQLRTLALLDGCSFPDEHFSVAGVSIQRFTVDRLRELGPAPEVAREFFPEEALDPSWFGGGRGSW